MELTSDQIQQILPHRYPMLLLDRVLDFEPGRWARALKCVTVGDAFFQGHFPGNSIMPGVLLLEAIAQTGAVALMTLKEYAGKLAVFGGVKNARFLRRVTPGDAVELMCTIDTIRGGIGFGTGTATVAGQAVCSAQLTFAIVDN